MPTVRDESERRHVASSVLLVSSAMAVSGVALTVSAITASLFLGRGSMRTAVFVAITVLFVTIAAGRAAYRAITRVFPNP
jgi:hypothetical protein